MINQETEIREQENNSEDFETLLNESMDKLSSNNKKGDVIIGKISSINESHIIISLGQKQDAYAEIGDYLEKGELKYKVGDEIKGFIVKIDDDQITIAKSLNRSHGNKVLLKEAFNNKIPVKGKVIEPLKGGYSVEVFGVKAFCPFSHIDIILSDNPDFYLNHTFDFDIIEFEKGNIILSRKNILQAEIDEKKERFFANYKTGDTIKGTIVRLTNFGAFVDLGGLEGLLHISELSWSHVDKASEILSLGDEVEVKIIKIDTERIALSLKALHENPLLIAMNKLKVGDKIKCRVIRHGSFGSFVEIEKGVEALIPISLMSNKKINKPSEILNIDEEIEATVVKLDMTNLKISLSIKEEAINPWEIDGADLSQGMILTGVIENITDHGAFVKVKNSIIGLIPQSKMKRAKLILTADSIGEEIELRISSVNVEAQRLSLEPIDMPELELRKPDRRDQKDNKSKKDNKRPAKDHTNDNDWQRYATNYQSVPEDNPFNKL